MANHIATLIGYYGMFALMAYGAYRVAKWAILRTLRGIL